MREEKFKMERQGLIQVGDKVKISEFLSATNYSYIIEPAVAMSGCYRNADRIKSKEGIIKSIEHTPRGLLLLQNLTNKHTADQISAPFQGTCLIRL